MFEVAGLIGVVIGFVRAVFASRTVRHLRSTLYWTSDVEAFRVAVYSWTSLAAAFDTALDAGPEIIWFY